MVITGDINQSDLGANNGLSDFLNKYEEIDRIKVIKFTNDDIERHPVVKDVLKIYKS